MQTTADHRTLSEASRWDDYRALLAIGEEGSFQGAAARAGTATSTLSRHMAAWERRLGVRIFDRRSHGVTLTEAGRQLFALAQQLAAQVESAERNLRGLDHALTGRIRLTAGEGFGDVLVPLVAEFRALHPHISLELSIDTRIYDLARGEADVAIRMPRPHDKALVLRKLGAIHFALYAVQAYLDRHGTPRSVAELARHQFVGFAGALADMPPDQFLRALGVEQFAVRVNSTPLVHQAARQGLGIALIVPQHARGLVHVLPELKTDDQPVWLVRHRAVKHTRRFSLLADFLARRFAELSER